MIKRLFSLTASSALLLSACATQDQDQLTPLADAEDAVEAAKDALDTAAGAPQLGVEQTALLKESIFVAAAIPNDVPGDFTGCYEEALACFVGGDQVDVAVRFEPQSGRFWFLDPSSGNTYFADGELRTENGFRAAMANPAATAPTPPTTAPSLKPDVPSDDNSIEAPETPGPA